MAQLIRIEKSDWGKVDGKNVFLYTIANGDKMHIRITNYGGIVTSIVVPDRNGVMEDVVLGFDNLQQYLDGHPYFGCIVGRCANRISGAQFVLDNTTYRLANNMGDDHLHGGITGFDKKVWDVTEISNDLEIGLELSYTSPDSEEGYPGEVKVWVQYTLTKQAEFKIRYFAQSTKPTPLNLTHHSYFNLKGAGNGDMLDHELMINADRYNVISNKLLPTGELRPVAGTPMDFRKPKRIGQDMADVEGGYDHNFCLNTDGNLIKAAILSESSSGRIMEVYTDQPGMQFYGSNFLGDSIVGKNGRNYHNHYAVCLETQHFPDSVHHPEFPTIILRPGQIFNTETTYKFGTAS